MHICVYDIKQPLSASKQGGDANSEKVARVSGGKTKVWFIQKNRFPGISGSLQNILEQFPGLHNKHRYNLII